MSKVELLSMADLSHTVLLEPDGEAICAVDPAFAEIATSGNSEIEALAMARDATPPAWRASSWPNPQRKVRPWVRFHSLQELL